MLRLIGIAATACALVLASPAGPVIGQEVPPPPTLTMTGVGEARARPDVAVVRIGVVTQAATARDALNDNNRAMDAVLAALKEQGIAQKDLQTSSFNLTPRYDYGEDRSPPRVEGYEASNQLAVTVRNLDKLGGILDRAVSVGSNQIVGVEFGLDKPEPVRDEARRLAVRDAVRKARLYADEAGVQLGPIHSISERTDIRPPAPRLGQMRATAEAAAVPIEQGEQAVEVEVIMTWLIR